MRLRVMQTPTPRGVVVEKMCNICNRCKEILTLVTEEVCLLGGEPLSLETG